MPGCCHSVHKSFQVSHSLTRKKVLSPLSPVSTMGICLGVKPEIFWTWIPCCGTVDAEIKVPLCWEPRADKCFPFKAWSSSQYRHDLSTARNLLLVLISTLPIHSLVFFFKPFPYFLTALILADTVSCVGLWNKKGHPAHSHKQFKYVPVVSAYRI